MSCLGRGAEIAPRPFRKPGRLPEQEALAGEGKVSGGANDLPRSGGICAVLVGELIPPMSDGSPIAYKLPRVVDINCRLFDKIIRTRPKQVAITCAGVFFWCNVGALPGREEYG